MTKLFLIDYKFIDLIKKPIVERQKFCQLFQNKLNIENFIIDITHLRPIADNGCNALVSLAYENNLKKLVVVKKIMHLDGAFIIPLNSIYELSTYLSLKDINSIHLPKLIHVNITQFCTDIISEYIPMSFTSLFCSYPQSPSEFIELKINELIKTVKLLHLKNIAHRDIKSNNIRFRHDASLVLIDFDSASSTKQRTSLPICTLNTRAPEIIKLQYESKSRIYDAFACDWWSIGCILAEMFLGDSLFQATNETHPTIVLCAIENFCEKLHSEKGAVQLKRKMPIHLYTLLQNLLQIDPIIRMQRVNSFV